MGTNLAMVAAALGVPAAALAFYHDLIVRNPVGAFVALVVYEFLILLGKVASDPIKRRARQLGDLLDVALGRRFSRYGTCRRTC